MLYELSHFYRRDVYFTYSQKNEIKSHLSVMDCKRINFAKPLLYEVDKLDSYLPRYDALPAIGAMLVSSRFRDVYQHLGEQEIQFIPVVIEDEKRNKNTDFFCLNVLKKLPLLDFERSIYLPCKYDSGSLNIIQAFYHEEKIAPFSIASMEESWQHIIVSEEFAKIAKKAKLKGIVFHPEGHTGCYTELGLTEKREQMKNIYGK